MSDIELVIDIPEETYIYLRNGGTIGASLMIENAIKNGTPLPKGHGRLIDADAVLEEPLGNTYKDITIAETIVEAESEE